MANRVLVIRLSSLGDVVLTAPVYRRLKAHWPDCRVSVLVKPAFAAALEGHPCIDEVIPFMGFFDALRRVRAGGFTHLLDLHATSRSFLLRRLSGVVNAVVYRKHALARRFFVYLGWRSPSLEKHVVERYLEALAAWGLPGGGASLSLGDVRALPGGAAPGKVLVLQTSFLGDCVLTVPLAREVKKLWPSCSLSVLTLEKTADVFRAESCVDEVLLDDKRGQDGGLRGPWRLAARLKARGFDLAIVPHRSLRSALVAWLAGIPRRVGFSTSAGRFLLTDAVPFTWLMHDLERNLALLTPLAPGAAQGDALYLSPDAPAEAALAARLKAEGVPEEARLAGVHPGSAWPTKQWLEPRFAELCRRLERRGLRAVLVGGPQDRALCARIAGASGALDWSGKTDLRELRALMGRFSLFVTNDSGPMHLAAGRGVPTVAIFGPTTRELGFFPYGKNHKVLETQLPCRPCGLHGQRKCPEGHFLCMKLITVEQVFAAAEELLDKTTTATDYRREAGGKASG